VISSTLFRKSLLILGLLALVGAILLAGYLFMFGDNNPSGDGAGSRDLSDDTIPSSPREEQAQGPDDDQDTTEGQASDPVEAPETLPQLQKVTIAAVGDIMVHLGQIKGALTPGDDQGQHYDFSPTFAPIKEYIAAADLAIGNLETTLSGADQRYTGYPTFNSPEELAVALKDVGFDVLVTANNHSLDRREVGIIGTIDHLEEAGILNVGTARTAAEAGMVTILNVRDIRVALLAYTYGTNGIPLPQGKPFMVNLIDWDRIRQDIGAAREQGADFILTYLHFGSEYQRVPNQTQRDLVDFAFAQGADIVLGCHPHVLQPWEFRDIEDRSGGGRRVFAIYSLGNFVSGMTRQHTDTGIILYIDILKNPDTGDALLGDVRFVPTWVDRSYSRGTLHYRILPIPETLNNRAQGIYDPLLTEEDYRRMEQALQETLSMYETDEPAP